ncbi:galectin-5-like [Salarias fasciatus]|uniref:Galectin n=1 Tax=Salarias fasciatus TaxID=181472 RepID=A0A672I434_SALFA|nr:galectin-5-like [Salarias fasciatus]
MACGPQEDQVNQITPPGHKEERQTLDPDHGATLHLEEGLTLDPGPWTNPASGGGSNPGPGGWTNPASGGGSNPGPGVWPNLPQDGGSNSGPGWSNPPRGGGSYPSPGGWSGGPTAPSGPRKDMRVPYTDNLINGVYDKLLITITGTIKPNPQKFTVDLCKGRDIALHFNPRFNENGRQVIVRNTFNGGRWGQEERELQRFPFVGGQQFEMKILCTSSEYKVAVNGSHLLSYRHRITDLRSITGLGIYYDLNLTDVKMETLH